MFISRLFTGLASPVFLFRPAARKALPFLASPLLLATASAAAQVLPVLELDVAGQTVQAQVAATPKSRQQGLMFRESLAPGHGMLFVFPEADYYCFWMKNTPLPLSIAFIDADGAITSIQHMQPQSEQHHCSYRAVPYALEMEQGWFGQNGIDVGQQVKGLPPLPPR